MNNLQKIRETAHKTQKEIETMLGVDPKTYRKYEKGGKIPSDICKKLAEYYSQILPFKVSMDYLLGNVDSPYCDRSLRDFAEKIHLSEESINNLLLECSTGEDIDNRRVFTLDLLLSDREAFRTVMDCIHTLIYPVGFYLDKDVSERYNLTTVYENGDIGLNPSLLQLMSDSMPDHAYQKMRAELEKFKKRAYKKCPEPITPNEWSLPTSVYDSDGNYLGEVINYGKH